MAALEGDDGDDDDESAKRSKRRKALVATGAAVRFQSPLGKGSSQTTSQTSQEDTHSNSSSTASAAAVDKDSAKQQKKEDPSPSHELRRSRSMSYGDKDHRPAAELPKRSRSMDSKHKTMMRVLDSPTLKPQKSPDRTAPKSPGTTFKSLPRSSSSASSISESFQLDETAEGDNLMSDVTDHSFASGLPSRTQSSFSLADHSVIDLIHTSVNAKKDAEVAEIRAQHQVERQKMEHDKVLLTERMRMEKDHRLEKEALMQQAEIRETRLLAAAACAMAVAIALVVRK